MTHDLCGIIIYERICTGMVQDGDCLRVATEALKAMTVAVGTIVLETMFTYEVQAGAVYAGGTFSAGVKTTQITHNNTTLSEVITSADINSIAMLSKGTDSKEDHFDLIKNICS